jgi:hypothetical protein
MKEAIMVWRVLVTFALLGATALPASAAAPSGMTGMTRAGDRIAATPVNDSAAAPQRIEGKVLAIDPQHGSFLLATDAGMIALRADPEDLAGLHVGQTLTVEVIHGGPPDEPNSTWQ